MSISTEAKIWLEDNIEYIDSISSVIELKELVKKVPAHLQTEIKEVLEQIDIKFIDSNSSSDMWGIKSIDGYRTFSLGKWNGSSFNVNATVSQGMKGGFQIGFNSVTDAEKFLKNMSSKYNPSDLRLSLMQPKVAATYNWKLVTTEFGDAYVTDIAFNHYDPAQATRRRLENKANKEVAEELRTLRAAREYKIEESFDAISVEPNAYLRSGPDDTMQNYIIIFYKDRVDVRRIDVLFARLKAALKMNFKLFEKPNLAEDFLAISAKMPQALKNEHTDVQKRVYAKYGL